VIYPVLSRFDDGFSCPAVFGSAENILSAIVADPPDVVLVHIGLPGASSIDPTRVLKGRSPNVLLVVLTVYEDDRRISDEICAGASGYLLKKTPTTRLLEGIGEVVSGGAPMSPEVADRVIQLFRQFRPAEAAKHDLTPHEIRLLKLLVEGHNYKTAALN
jgi:DNA-binding NarL/FixJ family response regulator